MKILLTIMLLACSTVALAQTQAKRLSNQRIEAVPQAFTVDGKSVLYLVPDYYYDEEEQVQITILDEDLQAVRTFNLVECVGKSKVDIQARKDVGTIEIERVENYQCFDGDKDTFTEEEAIAFIASYFGYSKSDIIVDKREEGTYLFLYSYEELNGVKYARYYGFLDNENKLFRCYMYYNINHAFTGEWESRTEESIVRGRIEKIDLHDLRSTTMKPLSTCFPYLRSRVASRKKVTVMAMVK